MKFYVIGVADEDFDKLVDEMSRVVGWAHKNLSVRPWWNSGDLDWLKARLSSLPADTQERDDRGSE